MAISRTQAEELLEQAARSDARAAAMRARAAQLLGTIIQTAEVGAAAFGFGYARGRYGDLRLLGVPMDLGTALFLHIGGFVMNGKRRWTEHLHNLGDGALAEYLTVLGADLGVKALQAKSQQQQGGAKTTGYAFESGRVHGLGGGGGLSMDEINAAAAAARQAA